MTSRYLWSGKKVNLTKVLSLSPRALPCQVPRKVCSAGAVLLAEGKREQVVKPPKTMPSRPQTSKKTINLLFVNGLYIKPGSYFPYQN
jgi:hypothetical protein